MAPPPDDPRPLSFVAGPALGFEEESTVSIKPPWREDDPTEPFLVTDSAPIHVGDELGEPSDALLNPDNPVLRRVTEEVERIRDLAGTRAARITPEILAVLRLGVALPGPTRLTPDMAIAAASGLLALTDDQYAHASRLLANAGLDGDGRPIDGADRERERALILRAVAERRGQLETSRLSQLVRRLGIPVASDRNLGEIAAFAAEIRGRGTS